MIGKYIFKAIKKWWVLLALFHAVVLNTSFFWDAQVGLWGMLIALFLGIIWFVIICILVFRIVLILISRLKSKPDVIGTIFLSLILLFEFLFPRGIVDYEILEEPFWFAAYREGVANCGTSIKLRENNKFTKRSVCFSVDLYHGTYLIKGDTIFLTFATAEEGSPKNQFAIMTTDTLKNGKVRRNLSYHQGKAGTAPLLMNIHKYEPL